MAIMERRRFRECMSSPEQLEASVCYMTERIAKFLKRRERVLICLPDTHGETGWIIAQAVERCEGIPIYLGNDMRWKTIFRTAFSSHCGTIVAEPLVLLGLSKLTKKMGVPLFIRNAILAGYPCMPWMRKGIERELDCRTYGCFDPGGVVSGFLTHEERILWLRNDLFDAYTRDEENHRLPDGELGEMVVCTKTEPVRELPMEYMGKVCRDSDAVGIFEMSVGRNVEPDIAKLSGHLLRWSSILDCRVTRTSYGLELEIVTFPGEKLPKLPNCAKQVVRPWDPEREIPFSVLFPWDVGKNH